MAPQIITLLHSTKAKIAHARYSGSYQNCRENGHMISELAGFTLSRSIPDSALMGVMSGAYKVCGGVIRDSQGQIVSHLVNAANPLNIATSLFAPLDLITSGINTFQLSQIGADVTKLISLAQGTMALSGLTLAVSTASFLFLNNKLNSIDSRLQEMSKDVKAIRQFLEMQERARLATSLKTMMSLDASVDSGVREKLLISAKQTLGEIHEKYREAFLGVTKLEEALAIEEYFTVTALGHALCTAELDMYKQAENNLQDAYQVWDTVTQRIARDFVIRDEPERLMSPRYADYVKANELIDWLDFSFQSDRGLDWIDELRGTNSWIPKFRSKLNSDEKTELEIMRKIVPRDRIYQGYVSQYEYYSKIGERPSSVQAFIESLPEENRTEGCLIFVADKALKAA
jgi:hypothetical protein